MAKKKRPEKREDPLGEARRKFEAGEYRDTRHSGDERRPERDVTIGDIREVLANGFWERREDRYHEGLRSWSYAIRGKTDEGRELRIPVAFDPDDDYLVFVTTRDLDAEREGRKDRS